MTIGATDRQALGSPQIRTQYIPLEGRAEALLYEPAAPGPKARIAIVFSHTSRNNFAAPGSYHDSIRALQDAGSGAARPPQPGRGDPPLGAILAGRGYRALMVNNRADGDSIDAPEETFLPAISRGIAALRQMPGVESVVLVAHSGGCHLGALYQNVAENGPAVCQGPEKIYPCDGTNIADLEKFDGVVLFDPTIGGAHQMTAVDPAVRDDGGRDPALDMFTSENGFDPDAKRATYSADFARRFYAAQAARNNAIVDAALERLRLIEAGKGEFANDEPFVIRGMGIRTLGARLYQPDPSFAAQTKRPHLLLRADGTRGEEIIRSVRRPSANHLSQINRFGTMNFQTTVRRFLANSAVRATADYAITADDIVGIDWASSYTSTPTNAEGITVPTLVMTMTGHYLMVPAEIVYDRLATADKTFAAVEGATHWFKPCRDGYGDTETRTYDFLDAWLAQDGRY